MDSTTTRPSPLKLSICITTFNRAVFIGATLDSILAQATDECEVVVLDGASTDNTEAVMSEYTRRFDRLRYIRQETNNGFDRDVDRMVELARGEYCWLMSDDDLLKPGAIGAVLEALRRDFSLVIVNVEARDLTMSKIVQHRWIHFESDRVYAAGDMDGLFLEIGEVWRYFGNIVIKRAIWLGRERQRYYDSLFNYFGVIFQKRLPGQVLVIAQPYVSYRLGNTHTFLPHVLEILWVKWPSLVRSMDLSESTRRKISTTPWRRFREVMFWRGMGFYTRAVYRQVIKPRVSSPRDVVVPTFVVMLPGALVNALVMFYYSMGFRPHGMWQSSVVLQALKRSPFHFRNWRMFKRES